MIARVREGERFRAFINWDISPSSRVRIVVRMWRFKIYFRIRSAAVGGRRIILDAMYDYYPWMILSSRIKYDFYHDGILVNGTIISMEMLEDISENPSKYRA
jgi:hypothetical protein